LFNVNVSESSAARRMAEVLDTTQPPDAILKVYTAEEDANEELQAKDKAAVSNLENVLAAAEDETDVVAARTARAEVAADLEEFDENINIEEKPEALTLSKAEQDIQMMVEKV
jgi:E1A-binding protein p400